MNECDVKRLNPNSLKQVIEGFYLSEKKGSDEQLEIVCRFPQIYCSNFPLAEDTEEALLSRFLEIESNGPSYDHRGNEEKLDHYKHLFKVVRFSLFWDIFYKRVIIYKSIIKGLNGLESTDWVLENAEVICINPPRSHWKWKRLNGLEYSMPSDLIQTNDCYPFAVSVPPSTSESVRDTHLPALIDIDTIKSLRAHISTLTQDQVRSLISGSAKATSNASTSSASLRNDAVEESGLVTRPPTQMSSSQMSRQHIKDQLVYWQKMLEEKEEEIIINDAEIIKIIEELNTSILNETGSSGIFDDSFASP